MKALTQHGGEVIAISAPLLLDMLEAEMPKASTPTIPCPPPRLFLHLHSILLLGSSWLVSLCPVGLLWFSHPLAIGIPAGVESTRGCVWQFVHLI